MLRVAILESVLMPAGHEVEFDRILVEELKALGHEACFFVPKDFPFKLDYGVPAVELAGGCAISYAGAGTLRKWWLALQREIRRKRWFDDAFLKAQEGLCDAIIVPTSNYRYTRALLKSKLKDSPVPVIFIVHGVLPKGKDVFLRAAEACKNYANIHFVVAALRDDLGTEALPNVRVLPPPAYTPRDFQASPKFEQHETLRLGLFGQYRKEKNVEFFMDAFVKADFTAQVELFVQGVPAKPSDAEAFSLITEKYKNIQNIKFWHEYLSQEDWQRELLACDVLLMPYASERYLYQWSAMLFTALGFYKPVLQSPEINPEVIGKYKIGEIIDMSSVDAFSKQLELFVNNFSQQAACYEEGLVKANEEFSPKRFVEKLIQIGQKK